MLVLEYSYWYSLQPHALFQGGGAAWCFASRVAPIDGPRLWLPDAAPTPPATASWKDASGWTSRIDLVFDVADDYGPGAVTFIRIEWTGGMVTINTHSCFAAVAGWAFEK